MPREGCPPKVTEPTRRAFITATSRRPKITLMELSSFSAEMGGSVQRITVSCTELGFMEERTGKKHCIK